MSAEEERRNQKLRLEIRKRLRKEHGSDMPLFVEDRVVSYIMANFKPNKSYLEALQGTQKAPTSSL